MFKTASGDVRLLWEGKEDAEGKEEEARSRDRVPKGSPGTGSRAYSRDKDPLRDLGCREQSWSRDRHPLLSDSVPSCPVPGRASRLPGGQLRAWYFSCEGFETSPSCARLVQTAQAACEAGHHGQSRERTSS